VNINRSHDHHYGAFDNEIHIFFKTLDWENSLVDQASTSKELTVLSSILNETFETGRKYAADFKANMNIKLDEYLPNRQLWHHS